MLAQSSLASTVAFVLVQLAQAQTSSTAPSGVNSDDWTSIRAAYEAGRHAIVATEVGHRARTPGQAWTTDFDARAFTTTPDGGGWSWGLELTHFGTADSRVATSEPLGIAVEGQRLERRWSESLTEWYVNDARGLEHGFTVHAPLSTGRETVQRRSEVLEFSLLVRGDLTPRVSPSRRDIAFFAESGQLVLNYDGLVAFDADGDDLAAHFESHGSMLCLVVDVSGADYPLTIDPVASLAFVKATNPGAGDGFGVSVAIHGDLAVIGAPGESSASTAVDGDQLDNSSLSSGAAYIFRREPHGWLQVGYLKADNSNAEDEFGCAVDVFGEVVVVGARGEASNSNVINLGKSDNSAPGAGAVYVFEQGPGGWVQVAYLKAPNSDAYDSFGGSVSIFGDAVLIGAPKESSGSDLIDGGMADNSAPAAGAAYVFARSGGVWSLDGYLKATNSDPADQFGTSVSLGAKHALIGAPWEDSSANGVGGNQADNSQSRAGAAYVFRRAPAGWEIQAYVKASNSETDDWFGCSVDIGESHFVVGAHGEASDSDQVNLGSSDNSAPSAGAAYVYFFNASAVESRAYIKAPDSESGDFFGYAVGMDGVNIVVGAIGEDSAAWHGGVGPADNSQLDAGAAYVYQSIGSSWGLVNVVKHPAPDAHDQFGGAVAVDDDAFVIGCVGDDAGGAGVGADPGGAGLESSGSAVIVQYEYIASIPGCHGNQARIDEPSSDARIGGVVEASVHSMHISSGVYVLFVGRRDVDASGCGVILGAQQEVLIGLDPFPVVSSVGAVSSGVGLMALSVPRQTSLVGLRFTIQAVVVDAGTYVGEFSDAMEFELRP